MNKKIVYSVITITVIGICIYYCGGTEFIMDEPIKSISHKEKVILILNKLEEQGEFIVQLYMGTVPTELRSVDYDKDEKKDIILIMGIPGFTHQSLSPGNIIVYLVDNAKNDFGKIDKIKIGRNIGGYFILEERKNLDQKILETIDSLYKKVVDLGVDVILFHEEMKDIEIKYGVDEETLKNRHTDKEIEILVESNFFN